MTETLSATLDAILSGPLAHKARGFLLHLPPGYRGQAQLAAALGRAYGTECHPDIRVIEPESPGSGIPVAAIRDMADFLGSTALGGGMKTFVVLDAAGLNGPAANAFLKTLEEPTRATRILLLTDQPHMLPATVLSRCEIHRVSIPLQEGMAEVACLLGDDVALAGPAVLERARGNPRIAAAIATFGLEAWLDELAGWLGTSGPKVPALPAAGKDKVPIELLFHLVSDHFWCAITSGTPGAWTPEQLLAGYDMTQDHSRGISRKGLDSKARLHALLVGLDGIRKGLPA